MNILGAVTNLIFSAEPSKQDKKEEKFQNLMSRVDGQNILKLKKTPSDQDKEDDIQQLNEIKFGQSVFIDFKNSQNEIGSPLHSKKQKTLEFFRNVTQDSVANCSRLELQNYVRMGIPDEIRPIIWFWLADIEKLKQNNEWNLYKRLEMTPNEKWDEQIEKDINRTYPDSEYFQQVINQRRLFRILRAYANYDGEIGYTQGMNFVAGNLLVICDPKFYKDQQTSFGQHITETEFEENCFWIFVHINFEKNWREVYKDGIAKALHLVKRLEQMIYDKYPEIINCLEKHDISIGLCFQQAFLTLMLYFTPFKFSKYIIDFFLVDGYKIILDILFKMIEQCRNKILEFQEVEPLFNFLRKDMINLCFNEYQDFVLDLYPTINY